ncbi:hypothetical protein YC2023_067121 [Brassica napus]
MFLRQNKLKKCLDRSNNGIEDMCMDQCNLASNVAIKRKLEASLLFGTFYYIYAKSCTGVNATVALLYYLVHSITLTQKAALVSVPHRDSITPTTRIKQPGQEIKKAIRSQTFSFGKFTLRLLNVESRYLCDIYLLTD